MTTLPDLLTPVTAPELAAAFGREGVPALAVPRLVAHSALESGWWTKCHRFNLGNRKASDDEPHTFYECGEEIVQAAALALEHADPSTVFVTREYRGADGRDMASVIFRPSHPMCRFAAFDSLDSGAADYVRLLRDRFPEAYAAACSTDADAPTAFVKGLKSRGYFTADFGRYLATFIGVLKMVNDKLSTTPSPPPSETGPHIINPADLGPIVAFNFCLIPGESIRDRIVRCCDEASLLGPSGDNLHRSFYQSLVDEGHDVDAWLADVRTSCAVVQRAIDGWCRRKGHSDNAESDVGRGMFGFWLGDLSFQHPAWVPYVPGGRTPEPGDMFYVAVNASSNNNHVGRFLRETSSGTRETFEGGGGDGTRTGKSSRTLGPRFDPYGRVLIGWWDADVMGYEAA